MRDSSAFGFGGDGVGLQAKIFGGELAARGDSGIAVRLANEAGG